MTHLPAGHDAYLEPRSAPTGTYQAPECDGYLASAKIQTEDLDADLSRLEALLVPNDDGYPGPKTIDGALRLLRTIRAEQASMPEAEDVECGYEGPVDATIQRLSPTSFVAHWTCPRCGVEQEDEREKGDDE